jgi:hypothetical protein
MVLGIEMLVALGQLKLGLLRVNMSLRRSVVVRLARRRRNRRPRVWRMIPMLLVLARLMLGWRRRGMLRWRLVGHRVSSSWAWG